MPWSEGSTSTWAPSGSLQPFSDMESMDEASSASSAGNRGALRPVIFVRATYRYLSMEVDGEAETLTEEDEGEEAAQYDRVLNAAELPQVPEGEVWPQGYKNHTHSIIPTQRERRNPSRTRPPAATR